MRDPRRHDRPRRGRPPAGRGRWRRSGPAALLTLLWLACACSPEPETLLQADRLIGSTPGELTKRLGEPRVHNEETPNHFGSMRWEDLDGADVLVIVKGGEATYVTYHFSGAGPFDEADALTRIGVSLPESPPERLGDGGARRWQPCGNFERLTINPATRLISVGAFPLASADSEG